MYIYMYVHIYIYYIIYMHKVKVVTKRYKGGTTITDLNMVQLQRTV